MSACIFEHVPFTITSCKIISMVQLVLVEIDNRNVLATRRRATRPNRDNTVSLPERPLFFSYGQDFDLESLLFYMVREYSYHLLLPVFGSSSGVLSHMRLLSLPVSEDKSVSSFWRSIERSAYASSVQEVFRTSNR